MCSPAQAKWSILYAHAHKGLSFVCWMARCGGMFCGTEMWQYPLCTVATAHLPPLDTQNSDLNAEIVSGNHPEKLISTQKLFISHLIFVMFWKQLYITTLQNLTKISTTLYLHHLQVVHVHIVHALTVSTWKFIYIFSTIRGPD